MWRNLTAVALSVVALAGSFAAGYKTNAPVEHPHEATRLRMLYQQAEIFPSGQTIIIGDSRTEGLYIPELRGQKVLNAGIGGTDLAFWQKNAEPLVERAKPSTVIVAVGVNDAALEDRTNPAEWEDDYRDLVESLGGHKVILLPILPIEPGKPMGDGWFDPTMISRLNSSISSVATSSGAELVHPPASLNGQTIDGCHLNAQGATRIIKLLDRSGAG